MATRKGSKSKNVQSSRNNPEVTKEPNVEQKQSLHIAHEETDPECAEMPWSNFAGRPPIASNAAPSTKKSSESGAFKEQPSPVSQQYRVDHARSLMPNTSSPWSNTPTFRKTKTNLPTTGVETEPLMSTQVRQRSPRAEASSIAAHLMHSFTVTPTTDAAQQASALPPVILTPHEKQIYEKLCEIILSIHNAGEYVSRERVQKELFDFYHVQNWYELRTQATKFPALMNLTDRQKSITFYMHIFEQIFNLCTLHDLEQYLCKFMNVTAYRDLLMGPLEKNPEVQRVFKYKLSHPDQSIPQITTGDVIKAFIDFQQRHRNVRQYPFDQLIEFLVQRNELESPEQLGLFCKSFPYLVQVSRTLKEHLRLHTIATQAQAEGEVIKEVELRLTEFKEQMKNELELSSFNKKKTPVDVCTYLATIVYENLNCIPVQPALYTILTLLRDDAMLRCLLNISIYLGTIDKPEVLVAELRGIYDSRGIDQSGTELMAMYRLDGLTDEMKKADRKKLKQLMSPAKAHVTANTMNRERTRNHSPNTSSNISAFESSRCRFKDQPRKQVNFKKLCSEIYEHLIMYDNLLGIEQLHKIYEDICCSYSIASFEELAYGGNDDEDDATDFISFLSKYRHDIDPRGELSVYEQITSATNQDELYSFVQQLCVIKNRETNESDATKKPAIIDAHVYDIDQIPIGPEKKLSIEKAIKNKFTTLTNFRQIPQMIKKVLQPSHKNRQKLICFEESLLDVNGLNQLYTSPTTYAINEARLSHLILNAPLMTNLYTWLQWHDFFQPKFDTLKSFLFKNEHKFESLRLLELSTGEIYRLPTNANLTTFEQELDAMHIRSAVAHLCSIILQEGLITRFPMNVYRTSMETWFRRLRSLAIRDSDNIDPLCYILDFLMHLPILIGQSRIVEELILAPLDKVFNDVSDNVINTRIRLWDLADEHQRTKLELWGHRINVVEWQCEEKWLRADDFEEKFSFSNRGEITRQISIDRDNISVPTTPLIGPSEGEQVEKTFVRSIPSTASSTSMADDEFESTEGAFHHIETIRHNFGIDRNLDPDSQLIVDNLRGMIERSLERLSNDLYLEQGHFVLELIQNADDNQYVKDCKPTLLFMISQERILVCNNEVGFKRSNISAVCNIGASTKGKHKEGFTGHKGIGFKSVFMISDRPEIHSRNYHLCFDASTIRKETGHTIPTWIDKCEETLPDSDKWTTYIRLPIKKDAQDARLKENFRKIESIFLLFLNRLKRIEVINQFNTSSTKNNDDSRTFTRIDHAEGQIIELQNKRMNETCTVGNLWLIVKKEIKVSTDIKKKLRDVKNDVNSTIIAIAFPLNGIDNAASVSLTSQPVFAYLPLCSYGFRFVLQADFEVPANRQDILHDNLWNEWLKSEMACLLPLAYEKFLALPELLQSCSLQTEINWQLTPIQIIKHFLRFFPSPNEAKPFFNRFIDESINLLKGTIKLPVACQNENKETITKWVSPTQCIIVRDHAIQTILSQDILLTHFNSYYVQEDIVSEFDEPTLIRLGCRQLDFSDIVQLIEISYKQNEQQHVKTKATIEQIAQWLVCLDYSLQQQREERNYKQREKEVITKLKTLKIIPLMDQSVLVSMTEFDKRTISFPLDQSQNYSKHLKILLNDVPTLDTHLLNFIEDKYPRRLDSIKNLLLNLGISNKRNVRDIYRQHILPVMSDIEIWSSKSHSVLIAYLLCIYEYLYCPDPKIFESDTKMLQNKMLVKTKDNTFVCLGSADVIVHLTSGYGCKNSLENLNLPHHQFRFISDDYLTEFRNSELYRTQHGTEFFVKFLNTLNMTDFLLVNISETPFINTQQLLNTKWANLAPTLSSMIHQPFIINDYSCEEFVKLLTPSDDGSGTIDVESCAQLLLYLDRHHDDISKYYVGSVLLARAHEFGGDRTPVKGIKSSFLIAMQQHEWIPIYGDKLFKPTDVYFIPDDSPISPLRHYLPHLNSTKVPLTNKDFIHNILHIKNEVEPNIIFELFMNWSCNLESSHLWHLVDQTDASNIIPCPYPATFRSSRLDSIENIRAVYIFLASQQETRTLLKRFCLWPIIFIPRDQNIGDFVFCHQTFWDDPSSLLPIHGSNGRIPIQSHYDGDGSLTEFFLNELQVEPNPRLDDYIPLLSTVQNPDRTWKIIEMITKLAMDQNKQIDTREKCRDIEFIPCMSKDKKSFKYTDHPLYPHDQDIANLFSEHLPIIQLPSTPFNKHFQEQFCLLFNIRNLNTIIQTKVDAENEQISTYITGFYRSCIDLIQSFVLKNNLISETQSNVFATVFSQMQFVCVDRIRLIYILNELIVKSPNVPYDSDTYIDQQSSKFYILKKYEHSEMRYIDAMVNFIVDDENARHKLSSYIKTLLKKYQDGHEKSLSELRESEATVYEPKWVIKPTEIQSNISLVTSEIDKNEAEDECDKSTTDKVIVTQDEIQRLMEIPSARPKLPQKKESESNTNTQQRTCFPARAGTTEKDQPSENKTSTPRTQTTTEHSNKNEVTDSQGSSINRNYENSHKQDQHGDNNKTKEKTMTNSNESYSTNETKANDDKHSLTTPPIEPKGPLQLPDPNSEPSINFERFIVSNFTSADFVHATPSDSLPINMSLPANNVDADYIVGRQGEEIVFNYLRWKYPNEKVTWVNQKEESGRPYDIHLKFESKNDPEEFIEVKTTRQSHQNTFIISIGEIKYLLEHPTNYYIYRVYYSDPVESSIITKIGEIEKHLLRKHLTLLMTYESAEN